MSFSKDGINACISVDERSRFKFREKFHKKKKKKGRTLKCCVLRSQPFINNMQPILEKIFNKNWNNYPHLLHKHSNVVAIKMKIHHFYFDSKGP